MNGYITPAEPLRAVAEALVRGGVRHVAVCPGSRSTPLALTVAATPGLRTWVHLDERAAAFFALGAARASRRPAAVLATSGTAVVEFAPAVAEARYGRVPLVLLTADRPPELHGTGANQTIDQVELYGSHAKWFAALPVPDEGEDAAEEARAIVRRALEVARTAPAGPVQLNLPYREPLLPQGDLALESDIEPDVLDAAVTDIPSALVEAAVRAARGSARPLIVCGPDDTPGLASAVGRLALSLRAPVVADVLSNLRSGPHERGNVITHHEALVRAIGHLPSLEPDLLLRFGGTPTSRLLAEWLAGLPARQLLVDDGGGWNRPTGPAISLVPADPVAYAAAVARAVTAESSADPAWLQRWQRADAAAAEGLASWRASLEEPFEGEVARILDAALPDGAVVLAGNSMPVRDLDWFMPGSEHARRLLGNRGASGIDGLLSTALGAAAAQDQPVVAVVGDLAFLHDLTALVAAKRLGLDATIVLIDNDGGGIFSFLPQGAADRPELGLPERFEQLFGTPHGLELGPLVSALGARHVPVDHARLAAELEAALARPGVDVLHLRTERARNVELHREAFGAMVSAVEAAA